MENFLYYNLLISCTIPAAHRAFHLMTSIIILLCRLYSVSDQHVSHFLNRPRSCQTTILKPSRSSIKMHLKPFNRFYSEEKFNSSYFLKHNFVQIRVFTDLKLCPKTHLNLFDQSNDPKDRRKNIWKN